MKGKFFKVLLLAMLVVALAAVPAFAGEQVKLQVNGDQADLFEVFNRDGTSMISAESFARLSGADVDVTGENVLINEQGKKLELTAGEVKGMLDNKQVELSGAPEKSGGDILIPLRFVAGSFGYEVGWDNEQKVATLAREETRDGMTPVELLVKSDQVVQDISTYTMEGTMDMNMKFARDGQEMEDMPQNMTIEMSGQLQNDPMEIYITQKMSPVQQQEGMEGMTTETYMTSDKMYVKIPEQGWIVQEGPFSPEFWEEQQDIQSDPLKAVEQMEEMGIVPNFGNDATIEGQDYYVVNCYLDMEKFQEGYQDIMQNAMQGFQQQGVDGDPEAMQKVMQQLVDNMDLKYFYTVYINKESLVSDIIKFDIDMGYDLDVSQLMEEMEQSGQEASDAPEKINISYKMKGTFEIDNLGEPFEAPDVSDAKSIESLQQDAGQQSE